MGWLNESVIREVMGFEKSRRVRLVLAVGYAKDDTLRTKKRKPLEDMSTVYAAQE